MTRRSPTIAVARSRRWAPSRAERAYDAALAVDHRLMPSLIARAGLLETRGDWICASADLDMALTNRPDDARLRLRRGELLLRQGDWMRGLPDYEARLEISGACYTPELPRWQGEPVDTSADLSRAARHRERRGNA